MPKAADAAMPTRQDLEPSPVLSIVERGPKRFEGRKLGILITDGVDIDLLTGLQDAIVAEKAEAALIALIALKVGGVTASDGSWVPAQFIIDGGPSVLFDAGALLPAKSAMNDLLQEATARDFVADAFPLLEKAGIADKLDEGVIELPGEGGLSAFVAELRKLRLGTRALRQARQGIRSVRIADGLP